MPSRAVDVAWHEMILMTREYHASASAPSATTCTTARLVAGEPMDAMPGADARGGRAPRPARATRPASRCCSRSTAAGRRGRLRLERRRTSRRAARRSSAPIGCDRHDGCTRSRRRRGCASGGGGGGARRRRRLRWRRLRWRTEARPSAAVEADDVERLRAAAARPRRASSPSGWAITSGSVAAYTRRLMRICPGAAASHRRSARIVTRADRGVLPAALEADPAERRVALRDADRRVQVVAAAGSSASASSQTRSRIATASRTARSAGVRARQRVVEEDHQLVAREALERALEAWICSPSAAW